MAKDGRGAVQAPSAREPATIRIVRSLGRNVGRCKSTPSHLQSPAHKYARPLIPSFSYFQTPIRVLEGFRSFLKQILHEQVHGPLHSAKMLKACTEIPVNMDDPRVRPYEQQGDEEVEHWMNAYVMATILKRAIKVHPNPCRYA